MAMFKTRDNRGVRNRDARDDNVLHLSDMTPARSWLLSPLHFIHCKYGTLLTSYFCLYD